MLYFVFFAGGLILSLICNELLLRFSQSLGIRNKNDVIVRWSNQSKPSLGGVSFYVVFVFSTFAFEIIAEESNIFKNLEYIGFLTGTTLAFFMGLADDAYNTKPFLKLAAQILCGVTLALTGSVVTITNVPYIDGFLTVIWVVALMNSLNMLDNMDGITATTSLFILISCLGSFLAFSNLDSSIWPVYMIAIIGALIGFLRFNIHPAKIFMGDAGSQFIGFVLAFFSIKTLWNLGETVQNHSWIGVVVALLAFTPAAIDSITVTINRLKKGKSPMVGGKDHTTHHLVYAGYNDSQVWYVFLLLGFLSTLFSFIAFYFISVKRIYFILPLLLFFFVSFWLLYRNTIRYKQPPKSK
ncbi:MAG: MraY family glycosyltransferase [Bacteroidota bacterium]